MRMNPNEPPKKPVFRVIHLFIGRRVLAERTARCQTQEDFARESKVSRTTVSNYERGKITNIGVEHLENMAHALKLSFNTLRSMAQQDSEQQEAVQNKDVEKSGPDVLK